MHFQHALPLYYIRHVQRRLKNSNHSLTSVVFRIHAPMEAPALSYLKTLKKIKVQLHMCCGILRQILSKTKCNIMQRGATEKRRKPIWSL